MKGWEGVVEVTVRGGGGGAPSEWEGWWWPWDA